jgi:hypothetical protein
MYEAIQIMDQEVPHGFISTSSIFDGNTEAESSQNVEEGQINSRQLWNSSKAEPVPVYGWQILRNPLRRGSDF